jgi:heme-degrading monooxygenase HmoA
MVARLTLAEVDAVRMSIDAAADIFRESVMPSLHGQVGYEGCYVLTTAEGKAVVLTFWATEEAADAGLSTGFYAKQVEKFVSLFRAPPGRETYDVTIADAPAIAATSDQAWR